MPQCTHLLLRLCPALWQYLSVKKSADKLLANDDWQTIFSENSQWSPNWPRTRVVYETGQNLLGFPLHTTTYRRNPTSSQAKTRILFVDFDGYTWIYSPKTASWTRLSREDGHIDSIRHFSQLLANSITTLCGTRVIAFAGARGKTAAG